MITDIVVEWLRPLHRFLSIHIWLRKNGPQFRLRMLSYTKGEIDCRVDGLILLARLLMYLDGVLYMWNIGAVLWIAYILV